MSFFATNSSPVKMPDDIRHCTTIVSYQPLAAVDNFSDVQDLKYSVRNDTASVTLPTNGHTPGFGQPGYTVTAVKNAYNGDELLHHQMDSPLRTLDTASQLMKHLSLNRPAGRYTYVAAHTIMKQPPEFTIFGKLPAELTNKIWIEAANNEPRNIYAIEVPVYRNGGVILDSESNVPNPADSTWMIQISGTTIPNVLVSCKSAHDAVMKIGMYKPMFQMKTRKRAYFINPEIDRICLGSSLPAYDLIPCGTLSDYLANPFEVSTICRVALPLNLFEEESFWCIFSIESLFNLKELQLVDYVRHPAQSIPFQLVLDFESHEIPFLVNPEAGDQIAYRTEARPVYQGYTHKNAMLQAFSYIADVSEHDRLLDIWPLITEVFELVPHVTKLTLIIMYTN